MFGRRARKARGGKAGPQCSAGSSASSSAAADAFSVASSACRAMLPIRDGVPSNEARAPATRPAAHAANAECSSCLCSNPVVLEPEATASGTSWSTAASPPSPDLTKQASSSVTPPRSPSHPPPAPEAADTPTTQVRPRDPWPPCTPESVGASNMAPRPEQPREPASCGPYPSLPTQRPLPMPSATGSGSGPLFITPPLYRGRLNQATAAASLCPVGAKYERLFTALAPKQVNMQAEPPASIPRPRPSGGWETANWPTPLSVVEDDEGGSSDGDSLRLAKALQQQYDAMALQSQVDAGLAAALAAGDASQKLVDVSTLTEQDVADIDEDAVWEACVSATFECPIYQDTFPKEEGEPVGCWNMAFCNHWVNREALQQHARTRLKEHPRQVHVPCPQCMLEACRRCEQHGEEGGVCFIPHRQLRTLLSPSECLELSKQEQRSFRDEHIDSIAFCPKPGCEYWCLIGAEDNKAGGEAFRIAHEVDNCVASTSAPTPDASTSAPSIQGSLCGQPPAKWPQGTNMWCDVCCDTYCMHCSSALRSLVRVHAGETCGDVLYRCSEEYRRASERGRKESAADEGHAAHRGITWQQCPTCSFQAWKLDTQCNQLTCRPPCNTSFCFLCGDDISSVKHGHFNAPGTPCHNKCFHQPAGGLDGRPRCHCGAQGCTT